MLRVRGLPGMVQLSLGGYAIGVMLMVISFVGADYYG